MSPRSVEEIHVWRLRVLTVCVALAAVAFRQKPGLVVADTKFDLTQDPWRFLGKSLHLWDPSGAFGQLQNQAYGYLFPMGPFHGVLLSAGVPPWVTQRLWWSLLLCTAFVGMWRALGALGAGTPWTRLLAALAYALCPRIVSELTITSVEVWPMAMAPWVLWPLLASGQRTWRWRILWSAVALACCGGVNAVATGAALVLPTLWFLTRSWNRQLAGYFAAWLGACLLAIAWWLGPLVVLGRFSPPFLDWIEGSSITTSTASVYHAMRGTSAWLGFLQTSTGPQWPGGWLYLTMPVLVIVSTVVTALGLLGLTLRRTPERLFLLTSVLVGLVVLTAGHLPSPSAPWAEGAQGLLDGALAALRNAHKFDAVVRLPLAVGLAVAVAELAQRASALGARRWAAPLIAVSLMVGATAPALVANLARSEAYARVPAYWHEAARWLDAHPESGAALVLPAASFSDFTWGSTKDNPLQALMRRPLVVRDAVPLGSAGATRFLDGVQREVGAGRGRAALAQALATAGIRYVVVPNDLRLDAAGAPLAAVHSSLQQAGLERVAYFGPPAGNAFETDTHTVDYRTLVARPSVEVYEVAGTVAAASISWDRISHGTAGPEDSAALQTAGVALAVLGTDGADHEPASAHTVTTDGLRRREVEFGRPADNTSHVLTNTEPTRQRRKVTDFVADPVAPRTVTEWSGIKGVRASSSASDAGASLRLGPAFNPGAALDGDPGTRWVSGTFGAAVGEWWQVDLLDGSSPTRVRAVLSTAPPVGALPRQVEVRTASGAIRVDVDENAGTIDLKLPDGPVEWIRFTLTDTGSGRQNGFAISDVYLDGVEPSEGLRAPATSGPAPERIVLRRDQPGRSGCVTSSGISLCAPTNAAQREGPAVVRRSITLTEGAHYHLSGRVSARGPSADQLLAVPGAVHASASSRLVDSPSQRPGAAFDGDIETGWVAGTLDLQPRFTLQLPVKRRITGIQFLRGPHLAAAQPKDVQVQVGEGPPVSLVVDDEGYAHFTPRAGTTVRITILSTRPFVNVDSSTGARSFVPAGFSEVRLLGADDLRIAPLAEATVGMPCGFGPELTVNGRTVPTLVTGSFADLSSDRTLAWTTCGRPISLSAGDNVVEAAPSAEFVPDELVLTSDRAAASRSTATALTLTRPTSNELAVHLPARTGQTVVAVPQNFNAGWRAEVNGRWVEALRVNGWMQGWVVPEGAASALRAHFAPDKAYRLALAGGAVGLVCLVLMALRARTWGKPWTGRPHSFRPLDATILACVGGLALLGWWGLLGAVSVAAVMRARAPDLRAGRRLRLAVACAVVGLPLVASCLDVIRPWPEGRGSVESWWSQALIGAAVLLACLASPQLPRAGKRST